MLSHLRKQAAAHLNRLCLDIKERVVGSSGNIEATEYFHNCISSFGFETVPQEFQCLGWEEQGASLGVKGKTIRVFPGPYTIGGQIEAPLCMVTDINQLENLKITGKVVLLVGEIAREQVMPKNFPFYNPQSHKKIISLLEEKAPKAIIAATGRNPESAGAVYPFPLIEDGDFDIPSVFMTDVEGEKLKEHLGETVSLEINARRRESKGYNIIASKPGSSRRKIVFCAHIDSKQGTHGAIDNASGITVLLLLAELLTDYSGSPSLEIVALNGEDYYSCPGEILYLNSRKDQFSDIFLAINIDGIGYHRGKTAYSLYECPDEIAAMAHKSLSEKYGIREGESWIQSDHAIFVQHRVPACAVTSELFMDVLSTIAHTPKDTIEIIDPGKLAAASLALRDLLSGFNTVI